MVPEDYVHRIGRTGRAGVDGDAVSLVCVDELKLLNDIERVLGRGIPREMIPGFEPDPRIRPEPILRGGLGGSRPPSRSMSGIGAPRHAGGPRPGRPGPASTGRSSANRRCAADGGLGPVRCRSATIGRACSATVRWRTSPVRRWTAIGWFAPGQSWRRLRRSASTGPGDRQRAGPATAEPGRPTRATSDPCPAPTERSGHGHAGRAPRPAWRSTAGLNLAPRSGAGTTWISASRCRR